MTRFLEIHVGDYVLLSMKHLQLKDKPWNLHPFFVGPFKVTHEIGKNAMKLDLPAFMFIHKVFSISLLKEYKKDYFLPKVV